MKKALSDFSSFKNAFSIRNFRLYTIGNTSSLIGMWVQRLSVGWLIWELTESGAWLGAIAMAEFFPIVLLTPLGGVIADRYNRLKISMIAQFFTCSQALTLWILTVTDMISPIGLLILMLAAGTTNALNQAARVTLVVNMVPKSIMTTAIAINSIIFNVARIIGPAIGGVIIALIGISWAFLLSTSCYIALAIIFLLLRMPSFSKQSTDDISFWKDILSGAKFIISNDGIYIIILITAVNSLLARPIVDLLPGFAGEVFASGPQGLALMTSSMGIGAIFASFWLAQRGKLEGLTKIVFYGVLVNGTTIALFSISGNLFIGAFLLAVSGFTQACTGTGTQTLIQSSVDDQLRGRVMSVWLVIGRGGPALGALIMGLMAELTGFGLPVMIGAIITILVAIKVLPKCKNYSRLLEKKQTPV